MVESLAFGVRVALVLVLVFVPVLLMAVALDCLRRALSGHVRRR